MPSVPNITLLTPAQFKKIPWKNGRGITTELALNTGGNVDDFQWRLSIASVTENGLFSDFSGYWRNLVLISGGEIILEHIHNDKVSIDKLDKLLQVASFDGGSKTQGKLLAGAITDFNVITSLKTYQAKVTTYLEKQTIQLDTADIIFIYALEKELTVSCLTDNVISPSIKKIPAKHLLKITLHHTATNPKALSTEFELFGEKMIVVYLVKR
jgi:hypothetical protein